MADEAGPLTEEELLERLQEEMRQIKVPDYLAHLLVSLSSMAFQRLGLTPDTAADRDLGQARMAVDAFEALVGVLSPGLSQQEASLYRSTLHQMRMAFVRASGDVAVSAESSGTGSPGEEPAATAEATATTGDEAAAPAGETATMADATAAEEE